MGVVTFAVLAHPLLESQGHRQKGAEVVVAAKPSDMALEALWTWEDLWSIPDDGNLYEIIDGELYVMAPPIPVHQEISKRVFREFDRVAELGKLGQVYFAPIGVKLSERDIVEPDIIFIARDRLSIIREKMVDGAPDIVLEILSPSTRLKDLNLRATLYARSGVREYWQIDPRHRSVVVLFLADGAYVPTSADGGFARSKVLPGVSISIEGLFTDLT